MQDRGIGLWTPASSAAERNTFEMVPNILYSQTRGVSTVRGIMDDAAVKSGTTTTRIQAK